MKYEYFTVLKIFLIIAILSSMVSCATMMTEQNQRVTVTSTPPGARVYVNGLYRGTTPYMMQVSRLKETPVPVIRVTMRDHHDVPPVTLNRFSNPAKVANIIPIGVLAAGTIIGGLNASTEVPKRTNSNTGEEYDGWSDQTHVFVWGGLVTAVVAAAAFTTDNGPQGHTFSYQNRVHFDLTRIINITDALTSSLNSILNDIPRNQSIAVFHMTSMNSRTTNALKDAIYTHLDRVGFRVIDKASVSDIVQDFNISFNTQPDDMTAVNVANHLDADLIIFGNVTADNLRIKILDKRAAEIGSISVPYTRNNL